MGSIGVAESSVKPPNSSAVRLFAIVHVSGLWIVVVDREKNAKRGENVHALLLDVHMVIYCKESVS